MLFTKDGSFIRAPEVVSQRGVGEVFDFIISRLENRDGVFWGQLHHALGLAVDIHSHDKPRFTTGKPYITHPIECIESKMDDGIPKNRDDFYTFSEDILILLLHDSLESAPDRWKEILEKVGVGIFTRIVKLSKIPQNIKDEMYDYFETVSGIQSNNRVLLLSILTSNVDIKGRILNVYGYHEDDDYRSRSAYFQKCFQEYRDYLYSPICHDMTEDKKQEELSGLWHYLFFDARDAVNKFYDTMNNLSDVNRMKNDKKQSYLKRRVPKINALRSILMQFGLMDPIARLTKVWCGFDDCFVNQNGEFRYIQPIESTRTDVETIVTQSNLFNGALPPYALSTQ